MASHLSLVERIDDMRLLKRPVIVPLGCALSLLLLVVAASSGEADLRTGWVPLGLGLLAASCALSFAQVGWSGRGAPRWVSRFSSFGAAAALCVVSGFFFSLAVLYVAGSDLLNNDETFLAALGTAAASLACVIILPVATLVVGLALLRDRNVPRSLAVLPWAAIFVLIGGLATVAALPEHLEAGFMLATLALLALLITTLAFGVARVRQFEPDSADGRSRLRL